MLCINQPFGCRYELGKKLMPREWGILGDLGTGCVAQLVAGLAFTPIDVIKERIQVLCPPFTLSPQRVTGTFYVDHALQTLDPRGDQRIDTQRAIGGGTPPQPQACLHC